MIGRRYIHKSLGKEKSVAKGKNWPNFVKIKFNIIVVTSNSRKSRIQLATKKGGPSELNFLTFTKTIRRVIFNLLTCHNSTSFLVCQ